jgi:hypothetical protein
MRMTLTRSNKAWAIGLALLVAACGGGGGGDAVSRFGAAFAQAFRAAPTADPVEPGVITFAGVAGPVLTEEPLDI